MWKSLIRLIVQKLKNLKTKNLSSNKIVPRNTTITETSFRVAHRLQKPIKIYNVTMGQRL